MNLTTILIIFLAACIPLALISRGLILKLAKKLNEALKLLREK